jgi:hypothetical protein
MLLECREEFHASPVVRWRRCDCSVPTCDLSRVSACLSASLRLRTQSHPSCASSCLVPTLALTSPYIDFHAAARRRDPYLVRRLISLVSYGP